MILLQPSMNVFKFEKKEKKEKKKKKRRREELKNKSWVNHHQRK